MASRSVGTPPRALSLRRVLASLRRAIPALALALGFAASAGEVATAQLASPAVEGPITGQDLDVLFATALLKREGGLP